MLERLGEDEARAKAAESGHPEVAAEAALRLGLRLLRAGNGQRACPWLELAVHSNDTAAGAQAGFGLGAVLMTDLDDVPRARTVLRRALASTDPETAQLARASLEEDE